MLDLTPLAILAFVLIPVLLVLAVLACFDSLRRGLNLRLTRSGPSIFISSSVAAGTRPADPEAVDAMVRRLLASGRRDDAIILYRMSHGVSLREASDAIEAIERERD
jgi:hypothetical protein